MTLNFTEHAKIQIEERGLTLPGVIKDWEDGMFIKCFMDKKTEHFVTHIPEQSVFFLLVGAPRGNKLDVITCMPLTHRDRAVSADFKSEAYSKRNNIDCVIKILDKPKSQRQLRHEALMRDQQAAKAIRLEKAAEAKRLYDLSC